MHCAISIVQMERVKCGRTMYSETQCDPYLFFF